MSMSVGIIMLCGGIIGGICCLIALFTTKSMFARQRRKLLENLEEE